MKMQRIITVFMISFFSCITYASDWRVFTASEQDIYFVDLESIKKDELGYMKIWSQHMRKDGSYESHLSIHNCVTEETGTKAHYSYESDGSVLTRNTYETVHFFPEAPGTIIYLILTIACSDDPESKIPPLLRFRLVNDETPASISKKIFKSLESKPQKKLPQKKNG